MAGRPRDYARVQGMNRRKAGEDFYFLHKLIPLGGFTELTYTQVIPSPRLSDRVPFGTGKAMHDWLRHPEGEYLTYDPAIFETLPGFLTALLEAKTTEADWQDLLPLLHPVLQTWLAEEGFLEAWQEAKTQSKSPEAYRQRILRWLDGFRILKYVHHARDEGWPMVSVQKAATWLLKDWGITKEDLPVQEQLHLFRHKDRSGGKHSLY
ncbi:MAG TPA: hypothetical protein DCE41_20105 [Cytophagales bacterium]|nr:hypothetical protein [Cytophagales bacterium]